MKFADLRLIEPILRAVSAAGYTTATPIQAQAIPLALEGRDVLGCAPDRHGKKTACVCAGRSCKKLSSAHRQPTSSTVSDPLPERRESLPPRSLMTCEPTESSCMCVQTTIFGGVNQNPQVDNLRRGVDIIIATPGSPSST